jgi:hypothetical protein
MDYVVIWLICGIIGAMIGSKKGAGGTGFCLGVLLGPIGILIAIFMKGSGRKCAYCMEFLNPQATVCAHCQREQPATAEEQSADSKKAEAEKTSRELSEKTRLF